MAALILIQDSMGATPITRLLDALGVVFERRTLVRALASAPTRATAAAIISEDVLAKAGGGADRPNVLKELVSRYRHVLVYPFRGTAEGLRALSHCVDGHAELAPIIPGTAYSVATDFT